MDVEFKKCCGRNGQKYYDSLLTSKGLYDGIVCHSCPNAVSVSVDQPLYKLANAWNSIANGEKE